jgi:hypothetical protein
VPDADIGGPRSESPGGAQMRPSRIAQHWTLWAETGLSLQVAPRSAVRTNLPFEQSFRCPVRSRLLPLRLGQKSANKRHSPLQCSKLCSSRRASKAHSSKVRANLCRCPTLLPGSGVRIHAMVVSSGPISHDRTNPGNDRRGSAPALELLVTSATRLASSNRISTGARPESD